MQCQVHYFIFEFAFQLTFSVLVGVLCRSCLLVPCFVFFPTAKSNVGVITRESNSSGRARVVFARAKSQCTHAQIKGRVIFEKRQHDLRLDLQQTQVQSLLSSSVLSSSTSRHVCPGWGSAILRQENSRREQGSRKEIKNRSTCCRHRLVPKCLPSSQVCNL